MKCSLERWPRLPDEADLVHGSKPSDVWARVAFYTSLGFIIPGAVVAGYLVGRFLDDALHLGPALAVILSLAGAAAGIFEVIQLVTRMEKNATNDDSGFGKR